MNKYICISSSGEMEVEALSLIGASSKRNDESKIGYFGSGNKYAIAALIRNEIDFKIFSGTKEFVVTTKDVTFRDNQFQKIVVNGKDTSLTSDMGGKFWDTPFPIIRELYSNAIDEGNPTLTTVNTIVPEEGSTKFYIENKAFFEPVISDISEYFLIDESPIWCNNELAIYEKEIKNFNLFRKGIVATNFTDRKGLFVYSLGNIDVNESRLINSTWDANRKIGTELWKCTYKPFIRKFINGVKGSNGGMYEHAIIQNLNEYLTPSISTEWYEILKENKYVSVELLVYAHEEHLIEEGYVPLPFRMLKVIHNVCPDIVIRDFRNSDDGKFIETKANEVLVDMILEVMDTLNNTDYKKRIPAQFEFKYGQFNSNDCKAEVYHNNKLPVPSNVIRLSNSLVLETKEFIATTLIEEFEHINTGYNDESRALQTHLFNLYYQQLIAK